MISGYADGSFQPDRKVNRAEALKIIIAPIVDAETLSNYTTSPFGDVTADAWFLPYTEAARARGVIDGPPSKPNFLGGNTVIRAEFLKMLELANEVAPTTTLSELSLPLSSDVANVNEWFYPYMRYAVASSMIMVGQDGLLYPAQELTRGETALLLYRFIMYREGRRTQALLSEAENEILILLNLLEQNALDQANFASARGLIAARGAHLQRPDESIVRGAVKVSEAFRKLVLAYEAGANQQYEQVVTLAKEAWDLGASAKEIAPELASIAEQVQTIAGNMASSAREALGENP